MVKLLKKDRIVFYLTFIVLSTFGTLFLFFKTKDTDLIRALTSSNYIAIVLNNVYILYIYKKIKKIKSIYDKIICRVGSKKFFYQYLINSFIDIIIYFVIVNFIIYLKIGISLELLNFYIMYMILNFTCFFIMELVSMIALNYKNGYKYMILPVIINLVFYYYITPILILNFIGYK